jgi:hypothetical protein
LSNEQAQEVLEQRHQAANEITQRQTDSHKQRVTEWETQTWADPDLGGDKKAATMANVKLVMDKFAPEGIRFARSWKSPGTATIRRGCSSTRSAMPCARTSPSPWGRRRRPAHAADVLYGGGL